LGAGFNHTIGVAPRTCVSLAGETKQRTLSALHRRLTFPRYPGCASRSSPSVGSATNTCPPRSPPISSLPSPPAPAPSSLARLATGKPRMTGVSGGTRREGGRPLPRGGGPSAAAPRRRRRRPRCQGPSWTGAPPWAGPAEPSAPVGSGRMKMNESFALGRRMDYKPGNWRVFGQMANLRVQSGHRRIEFCTITANRQNPKIPAEKGGEKHAAKR